jgi:hypothetical protein
MMKTMRKIISQILVVLFLAISIAAQSEAQKIEPFDEFGNIGLEDLMARLDMLISESSKNPSTIVLIRNYGGSENCFLCYYRRGSLINAYLKNTRKFSTDKYTIDYCYEKDEERRTQLYLLTTISERPKCDETSEAPKNSALFDTISFYTSDKISPIENAVIEIDASEGGEYSASALRKAKKNFGQIS